MPRRIKPKPSAKRGNLSRKPNAYFSEPTLTHPIVFQRVLEGIHNSRLAKAIWEKVPPTLMIAVFRALDSRSFSTDLQTMQKGRENVLNILNKNAGAIWARILLTNSPDARTIVDAVDSRNRIKKYFVNSAELSLIEEAFGNSTGVPGWLVIEGAEKVIKEVYGRGGPLTAKKLLGAKIPLGGGKEKGLESGMEAYIQKIAGKIRDKVLIAQNNEKIGSVYQISMRVYEHPNRFHLPPELRKLALKSSGDILHFSAGGKEFFHSRIISFPGPMDVVKMPGGQLAAVIEGNSISLIALSPGEQDFIKNDFNKRAAVIKKRGIYKN